MASIYMAAQLIKTTDALKIYVNKFNINNKYNDLNKMKEKVLDTLNKMEFQFKDIKLSFETRNYFSRIDRGINTVKTVTNNAKTLEDLFMIKDMMYLFDDINELNSLMTYQLAGIAYDYYENYTDVYKLPGDHMRGLYRAIVKTNPLNIFEIYCNAGDNIYNFADGDDKTYANTKNYYATAKSRLTRVIKGDLKGSYISNNYFDIVMITPCVTYPNKTDAFGKMSPANESIEIRNCIKYVRQGGVYMITVPATRIDASLALWLSKVLSEDTIIVKIPGDQLERITIMGKKEITNKSKQSLLDRLTYINYDSLLTASDIVAPIFTIPQEVLELEYFRGSQLDVDDLLEAANPGILNHILESQTQPLVVKDQSPLLPFNIGQVGLVLTSGCLDGVVEEVDGVYHVIKGMTTKLATTETDDSEEDKIKSTETISNRVKINVFTADGKFIELG